MSKTIRIRKGLDIRLKGEAEKVVVQAPEPQVAVVKPTDFHGVVPKVVVKPGDEVKAGSPLFVDKYNERILFTSPVSGEVAEVVRGEKRRVLEVRVLADKQIRFEDHGAGDPAAMNRETIIQKLLRSGCWPFIRQRPFDLVADPAQEPKAIFVSAFDSAPLAPDMDLVVRNQGEDLQLGLAALSRLTKGRVHLNVSAQTTAREFLDAKGVQHNVFSGPHPAGNVGVQIHHIDPIDKGDVVWVVGAQDVIIIGRLFRTGHFDAERTVSLAGSAARNPKYVRVRVGAPIQDIAGEVGSGVRVVSGNALTGTNVGANGHLGFYDQQVTLLPEGDKPKFFLTDGWASPGLNHFSASHAYPTWLLPGRKYELDTNQNGEERAFVMSGQYEEVFPFDIYPVHLLKAILAGDIEQMEQLGLYEVAPEDFALCEFVCTSKINCQDIVRSGLDMLKKETT
ncbi:MAG: Na(+)-translocating NADH-quinone reductase subunit A [Flavobacteriales bacterium]|nr:Na(+)-translocating NADH-quinone reductase subunit A [Flavobacteriales bacterium]